MRYYYILLINGEVIKSKPVQLSDYWPRRFAIAAKNDAEGFSTSAWQAKKDLITFIHHTIRQENLEHPRLGVDPARGRKDVCIYLKKENSSYELLWGDWDLNERLYAQGMEEAE